jgi:hypothetical protein
MMIEYGEFKEKELAEGKEKWGRGVKMGKMKKNANSFFL